MILELIHKLLKMENEDDISLGSNDSTLSIDSEVFYRDINGYVEDDFLANEQSMCRRCTPSDEPGKTAACSHCLRREDFDTPLRKPQVSKEAEKPKYSRGKGGAALAEIARQHNVPQCIFWEDRRPQPNGACLGCKHSASILYFSRYPLCRKCEPLTVGIPLDHSKLPLIIGLRTEVNDIDLKLTILANTKNATRNPSTFLELTRRRDQIDRVLFELIKDH